MGYQPMPMTPLRPKPVITCEYCKQQVESGRSTCKQCGAPTGKEPTNQMGYSKGREGFITGAENWIARAKRG